VTTFSSSVILWRIYNAGARCVGLVCFRGSEQESKKTITIPDKAVGQRKITFGNESITFETESYITEVSAVQKYCLHLVSFNRLPFQQAIEQLTAMCKI
jgi:hypothetical protein